VLSISVSTVIGYGQYKCSNRAAHVENRGEKMSLRHAEQVGRRVSLHLTLSYFLANHLFNYWKFSHFTVRMAHSEKLTPIYSITENCPSCSLVRFPYPHHLSTLC
jgi:hypothetical protein